MSGDLRLNCRELIELLGDFLEGLLDAPRIAAFEAHLRACPPCVTYLATYRRTASLTGVAERVEMPQEMKDRLREFLLSRLDADRRRTD